MRTAVPDMNHAVAVVISRLRRSVAVEVRVLRIRLDRDSRIELDRESTVRTPEPRGVDREIDAEIGPDLGHRNGGVLFWLRARSIVRGSVSRLRSGQDKDRVIL